MDCIVLKVGGHEIDEPLFLDELVQTVRGLGDVGKVVVHGGGKEIADLQGRFKLEPRFIDGLRVTDETSLAVAEMVLAGRVNKRLVARLVTAGVPALGLSGVDMGLIRVEKMLHPAGDLGWVGRIVEVKAEPLRLLLDWGIVPVVSPISLGLDGHTYNVNADQAAFALARSLQAAQLVFISNVPGVLVDGTQAARLTAEEAGRLIDGGKISGGMVPKVRSALEAVRGGVQAVRITDLAGLRNGAGTEIVLSAISG
jgi:acetylglutamate kinase